MKKFLIDLFTWKGRWNRLKFNLYPLVIIIVLITILSFLSPKTEKINYNVVNMTKLEEDREYLKSLEDIDDEDFFFIYKQDIQLIKDDVRKAEEKLKSLNEQEKEEINNLINEKLYSYIIILIYIMILYILIVSQIKRLHDLNKSGWLSLLTFVPGGNIYLLIISTLHKGTSSSNNYGENPLKKDTQ